MRLGGRVSIPDMSNSSSDPGRPALSSPASAAAAAEKWRHLKSGVLWGALGGSDTTLNKSVPVAGCRLVQAHNPRSTPSAGRDALSLAGRRGTGDNQGREGAHLEIFANASSFVLGNAAHVVVLGLPSTTAPSRQVGQAVPLLGIRPARGARLKTETVRRPISRCDLQQSRLM